MKTAMALALERAGVTKVEEQSEAREPRPEDVAAQVRATRTAVGAKAIARNVLKRRAELKARRP